MPDTPQTPVVGADQRQATFVTAVQRYDFVKSTYGPADSTVRDAELDMIRAFMDIKLLDGTWASYPAPYDGQTEYDATPYG